MKYKCDKLDNPPLQEAGQGVRKSYVYNAGSMFIYYDGTQVKVGDCSGELIAIVVHYKANHDSYRRA